MTFRRTPLAEWRRVPYFSGMVRVSIAALAAALASSAAAQTVSPFPSAAALTPTDLLASHLRTLSRNPRDLNALLGAGQAALDVGDPNAALGFFGRAQTVDARNGRAKAGLGGALVQLERADEALALFAEAQSLGMAETSFAKDRGLAYDLRGDNKRAQKDYALALSRTPGDAELIRRYALSLGISGNRNDGLKMLDPLLSRQDQGAWRARAFILAMNGNLEDAKAVARQVMPSGLAASMTPFLTRLASLNPAERAHAVNFGTMPADGQALASVRLGDPYQAGATQSSSPATTSTVAKQGRIAALPSSSSSSSSSPSSPSQSMPGVARPDAGLIPSGEPLGPKLPTPPTTTTATPIPTPVPQATERLSQRVGGRIGPVDPSRLPPELRSDAPVTVTRVDIGALPPPSPPASSPSFTQSPKPTPTPGPAPAPIILTETPRTTAATPQSATAPQVAPTASQVASQVQGPPRAVVDTPAFEVSAAQSAIAQAPAVAQPPADPASSSLPAAQQPASSTSGAVTDRGLGGLGSIVATLDREDESAPARLPTLAEMRAQQRTAARKAKEASDLAATKAAAEQAAKAAREAELAKARAHPARIWVQVATGSNAAGVHLTWRRIRDANAALKLYQGYAIAVRGTNRVLAGPMKSAADARALISTLAKGGLQAMTYSSAAGEEAVKLAAK